MAETEDLVGQAADQDNAFRQALANIQKNYTTISTAPDTAYELNDLNQQLPVASQMSSFTQAPQGNQSQDPNEALMQAINNLGQRTSQGAPTPSPAPAPAPSPSPAPQQQQQAQKPPGSYYTGSIPGFGSIGASSTSGQNFNSSGASADGYSSGFWSGPTGGTDYSSL